MGNGFTLAIILLFFKPHIGTTFVLLIAAVTPSATPTLSTFYILLRQHFHGQPLAGPQVRASHRKALRASDTGIGRGEIAVWGVKCISSFKKTGSHIDAFNARN